MRVRYVYLKLTYCPDLTRCSCLSCYGFVTFMSSFRPFVTLPLRSFTWNKRCNKKYIVLLKTSL